MENKWRDVGLDLAGGDVDTNGDNEDCDETKEEDAVDQYGDTACLHVCELNHPALPRELEQQPWRQHYKQHKRYYHRSPICHLHSLTHY